MASDLKLLWETNAFEIKEGATLIGRKDADITIPEKSLSKEHARILRAGSRIEIEDAGSKNGTLVNEKPVAGRVAIAPGDVIRLGGRVELRLVSNDAQITPLVAAPAPVVPRARFAIVQGENKGKTFPLDAARPFTIGTKEENSLALRGEGISRYHAEVVFEKGTWVLKDLGSRNGTFIAGRKLDLHELAAGDVIQIGPIHLEFQQDVPKAAPLADLVNTDPKALAKNPHIRKAVMLVVGAACLTFLALRRGSAPPPPPVSTNDIQKLVHDSVVYLQNEEPIRARDVVAKALRQRDLQANATLQSMDQLAKIWMEHKSPVAFEWTGANETIDKLIHGAAPQELDQDCQDWLQKSRAEAQAEIPNAQLRTQADQAMGAGQNALRAGKMAPAYEQLKNALELYRAMPPTSVFAPSARDRAESVRKLLLDTYKREADARIAGDRPRWDEALALFGEARKFADTFDERRPIDERSGICEINVRDEKALAEVQAIVNRMDESQYPRARELLEGIAETSRCYGDSVAYRNWFKADQLVRDAVRAYDKGAWEQAQKLMGDAMRVPDLRPQALKSVETRLARWAKVETAWRTGYEAEQKGDIARARELYKALLDLEPNRLNLFRQRAEKQLAALDEREQGDIDAALKAGIELLDQTKYADAYDKFVDLLTRTQNTGPAMAQITDAVARVNKSKGLLKEANRLVLANTKGRFQWAADVALLLATFLPDSDADKGPATQLLSNAAIKPLVRRK